MSAVVEFRRITRETAIADEEVEVFLALYRESFEALATRSPLRQSMTDDEFREEMRNPLVTKLVGWDAPGVPAAILCTTNSVACIPWLEPRFYQGLFPKQFADQSIFWVGTILVHPDRKGLGHVSGLIAENVRVVLEKAQDGICTFDCCKYNATEIGLPVIVESVSQTVDPTIRIEEIDSQHFYALRRVA